MEVRGQFAFFLAGVLGIELRTSGSSAVPLSTLVLAQGGIEAQMERTTSENLSQQPLDTMININSGVDLSLNDGCWADILMKCFFCDATLVLRM